MGPSLEECAELFQELAGRPEASASDWSALDALVDAVVRNVFDRGLLANAREVLCPPSLWSRRSVAARRAGAGSAAGTKKAL
jgi:hypothetical protein